AIIAKQSSFAPADSATVEIVTGNMGRLTSMPHDILNSMRALREDMRQRLLQVPEYRALVALDHSIDEICLILQDSFPGAAPESVVAPGNESCKIRQISSIE